MVAVLGHLVEDGSIGAEEAVLGLLGSTDVENLALSLLVSIVA